MARERRREEELYVTIPSLFRCPISMDVMKSPVSLCTGITYDRSSIEKWLSLGHKTCPATMQTLPSTHTTPNLTLRRLIHLWISHADLNRSPHSPSSISKQEAANVINGEFSSDSLAKVIGFMTASEENLRIVALSDNSLSRFVEGFARSVEIRVRELIVEILDLISPVIGVREKLNQLILKIGDGRECLSSFSMVLQKGNTKSKVQSAKILELIAVNPESQRKIAVMPGLLYELYNLATVETDTSSVEASLSALLAISATRQVKKELIRYGIVRTVGKILSNCGYSTTIHPVIEKALAMLENVATCTEGRWAIAGEGECVVGIVKRLMKCSGAAMEHGITVLWSICCLARDGEAQERVATVDGLTKVLLVMQSACTPDTRQMCVELVKVLRAKSRKSNLSPYETRTTHIKPY
ncbi:hypothetical protein OROGR_021544 [Orobanche gracilis]